MAEGRSFLRRLARQFPDRPVWIFSSGPTGEDPLGDPAEVAKRASAAAAVPADVANDAAGADLRGHVTPWAHREGGHRRRAATVDAARRLAKPRARRLVGAADRRRTEGPLTGHATVSQYQT